MRWLASVLAGVLLALLVVHLALAEEYSLKSLEIKDDLSLVLHEVDFSGSRYSIHLDIFQEASDPSGLYWKLGDIDTDFLTREVKSEFDIPYVTSGADPSGRQKLDVYYSTDNSNARVILFVPGGGWQQGDKSSYTELATTFVKYYGFTVVVTNYRLSNSSDGDAVHPDHVNDVASAFAWVKQNVSRYGGDPSKVFLFGQSAGAHLVSLLATNQKYLPQGYTQASISGVISMSGVYELSDLVAYPNNPLGLTEKEVVMYKKLVLNAFGTYSDETVLNDGSPQEHITTSLPHFLVLFAEDDMPGFPQEALNFVDEIRNVLPNDPDRAVIRFVSRADISEESWDAAATMASSSEAMADYVGHYAEVFTINQHEYNGRITSMVADFVNSH